MEQNNTQHNLSKTPPKPEFIKTSDGYQMSFTDHDVRKWYELGRLPAHLAEHFFSSLERSRQSIKQWKEVREQYPNDSADEQAARLGYPGTMPKEESVEFRKNFELSLQFNKFLEENWNNLTADAPIQSAPAQVQTLYAELGESQFGISRAVADAVYHLKSLLENLEVKCLYKNQYEARGSKTNSVGETLSLIYEFPATSVSNAEEIAADYKKTMLTKGVKLWMAYWRKANEMSSVEYNCPMIDVMKLLCEEDREANFSVKEKQSHWAITRMLGSTKIMRSKEVKQRGKSGTITRWIEQPLVEIFGGEQEAEANDKYPSSIWVRVLAPTRKAFAPAMYENRTLTLSPGDSYLAFKIQTRASQRGRGEKRIYLPWDCLFEDGNLQKTASAKEAVAKTQVRKKMDRFKEHKIIEDWDEELTGVAIQPRSQKKKGPKSGDPTQEKGQST